MSDNQEQGGHGFGTLPVFLAGISTILGAVMFLRFGYAVGHVGLLGSIGIILLGHAVTVPTALAIAEIATNRKVEGGGEYYIISRSFGTTVGSVIGVSLYLSQAISVAFYMIAFAEAFQPLAPWISETIGMQFDPRMVSIPASIALIGLVLWKGADLGIKVLYGVVATLVVSLVLFFAGGPVEGSNIEAISLTARIADPDSFFVVFAICFPAFTGMTAGVGLSGDLANPRKSIPQGTLAATFVGMFVYIAIVTKLAASATPDALAGNQLIMQDIAAWGPIIPIGLGAATLSSAIGSILVAPRTLQALASDASLPIGRFNPLLASGVGASNDPKNATLVTAALALLIVAAGDVDFVARLISMFFMVTYGALNAISFLEHFAARPSYRPSFRSRWYLSLFGAAVCLLMMFQMDPVYAVVSLSLMALLYALMQRVRKDEGDDLEAMFQGVMTQLTRYLQLNLQERRSSNTVDEWRPSILMVDDRTFDRRSHLDLLSWLCHRHGFGTYLHFIPGQLNRDSSQVAQQARDDLMELRSGEQTGVYMDTIISPSMISALAQSVQVPGVSGLPNNSVMFEVSVHDEAKVAGRVASNVGFAAQTGMDVMVLRHGDHHFGKRKKLHLWLTWDDHYNANKMVLLAYILLGHPAWSKGEITVFAAMPSSEVEEQRVKFESAMAEGRVPIASKNIQFLAIDDGESFRAKVEELSASADLTIIGLNLSSIAREKADYFKRHAKLNDVLFVHAGSRVEIE